MRRGKRFLNNSNIYIYIGTAIFLVLAISLGIIMYMLSKTATKLDNEPNQIAQEQIENEEVKNVSTEIGKKVEEQTSDISKTSENNNVNTNTNISTNTSSTNTNNTNETNTSQKTKDESKKQTSSTESTTENKADETETKKEITFVKPTEGEILCEFAKDNLIYSETLKEWMTHTGIDIKADKTSVIKASADGIVRSIVNDPRYGLTVTIEHDDGYETVYSNLLTAEFVVEGEEVKQGQTIGTAGNTASFESEMECHLHFEILKDGEYVDPAIYIK